MRSAFVGASGLGRVSSLVGDALNVLGFVVCLYSQGIFFFFFPRCLLEPQTSLFEESTFENGS